MPKLGYIALSKESWKTEAIEGLAKKTFTQLKGLDATIFGDGVPVTDEAGAVEACRRMTGAGVDALIVHFTTFPVGAIIPEIARRVPVPILLFANPEEPSPSGVLLQNSFCGANMAAHVLAQMGRKYSFIWGRADEVGQVLAKELRVLGGISALGDTRLGLAGGRVPGFYTSNFNELKLREKLGVGVEVMDLLEIVDVARNIPADEADKSTEEVLRSSSRSVSVPDEATAAAGRLLAAFRRLAQKYRLDGYAVRCWPELSDIFGIAPCAVLGMLNDSGLLASCEGDIHGAMTMRIQKLLSGGGMPFFVDLIKFDDERNTGVVWHCGAAPAGICRSFSDTALRLHMRVDGGDKKGLTNDFPIKPGRITLAKLDESPQGKYRMLMAGGEALDTEATLRGNPLTIRFDAPMRRLIDTIMKQGFEHHYCVVHADIREELTSFCEWRDVEVVCVD